MLSDSLLRLPAYYLVTMVTGRKKISLRHAWPGLQLRNVTGPSENRMSNVQASNRDRMPGVSDHHDGHFLNRPSRNCVTAE